MPFERFTATLIRLTVRKPQNRGCSTLRNQPLVAGEGQADCFAGHKYSAVINYSCWPGGYGGVPEPGFYAEPNFDRSTASDPGVYPATTGEEWRPSDL